ncbi:glycine-rich cell wall structural protein-like [Portunus trituberculatus]|uniref:glycine-rich cell wall structural protein-like n=1 Tax=Portunus trituberculatus TaxID=210409 RepID=UPI001E1CF76B|nr:glycine-rich cell wall structural protein-like [Portunus trituberculatus]
MTWIGWTVETGASRPAQASRTLLAASLGLLLAAPGMSFDSLDFSASSGYSGSFEDGFRPGGFVVNRGVGRVIGGGRGIGGGYGDVDDFSLGSGTIVHGGSHGGGIVVGGHGGGYGGGNGGVVVGGHGGGHGDVVVSGHGGYDSNIVVGGGVVTGGRVFSGKRFGNLRRGRYGGHSQNHGLYSNEYVTGISSAHLLDAYYDVDSGYGANTGFDLTTLGGPYASLRYHLVGRNTAHPGNVVVTGTNPHAGPLVVNGVHPGHVGTGGYGYKK